MRVHGTTQKVVAEAFAAERPELQALPTTPFDALLKLERRVSHDGLVSIGGNYYSVPDRTRRLDNDGDRLHSEIAQYAAFSQSIIQLTKIVSDGMASVNNDSGPGS